MTLNKLKYQLKDSEIFYIETYADDWNHKIERDIFKAPDSLDSVNNILNNLFESVITSNPINEAEYCHVKDWEIIIEDDDKILKVVVDYPGKSDYVITICSLEDPKTRPFQYVRDVTVSEIVEICDNLNNKYGTAENLLVFKYERVTPKYASATN